MGNNLLLSRKFHLALASTCLVIFVLAIAYFSKGQTLAESTTFSATDNLASTSSTIALSPDGVTLWVVNPDANSITAINTNTLKANEPIAVGKEPWSIEVSPLGVVVANRQDGTITLLQGDEHQDILVGPELGGVALSPSGQLAYVTVSSTNEVAVVDLENKAVTKRISTGYLPWAIAVTDNGDANDHDETIIVTHHLARLREGGSEGKNDGKEAWLTIIKDNEIQEISISPFDFGFANALESLAVVDNTAWITHLLNSPELPRTFFETISGGISTISLESTQELLEKRIHVTDSDFSTPVNFPRAIAVTPNGNKAYVVLAGTNAVMGIDLNNPENPRLLGFWAVGDNPRGIALSPDSKRAYVMNYLSRDVSVLDLTDTVRYPEVARISTTPETLDPEILRGKIIFNNANDPRISRLGWMSCASCHVDGRVDGTSWMTPEGLRQTMPLWKLADTEPLHISATRDEVQDFEDDIETLMNGVGFAAGPAYELLGEPNGGISTDLDALAAFVLNGIRVPYAPKGDSEKLEQGRLLFKQVGCSSCHNGKNWTNSHLPAEVGKLAPNGEVEVETILHDVGTYNSSSDILGEKGFDVPTLLGLYASAPYLHDGSAKKLAEVLQNSKHTQKELNQAEIERLTYFLKYIDINTEIVLP